MLGPTPRPSAGKNVDTAKAVQVAYVVTHKHRLRDCHGTFTFTRDGIRFESDAPEDSFEVGRDADLDQNRRRVSQCSRRGESMPVFVVSYDLTGLGNTTSNC